MTSAAARLSLIPAPQLPRAPEPAGAAGDVISLSVGEPDFDTPAHVIEAAIAALRSGQTRYTPIGGTYQLRTAVIEKFRRDNGLTYGPTEVIATPGAKNAVFLALLASVEPGDEVIVPAPHWVSYTHMTRLVGGVPVVVKGAQNNGHKLDAATLEQAITPRTRWVMLNTPNNPTGAVYSAADLEALAAVLRRHPHVMLAADEIYEHIVFDGIRFHSFASLAPDLKERTLTINGVSKSYAMTGWRIGYAGGPAWLISAMLKATSQTQGSICAIGQAAATAALLGPQDFLAARAAEFQDRRDRAMALLNAIPGLRCHRPEGAFYLFAECASLIGRRQPDGRALATDGDIRAYLLDAARVTVMPGTAYSFSPYVRISIATSMEKLEEACGRIADAIDRLR